MVNTTVPLSCKLVSLQVRKRGDWGLHPQEIFAFAINVKDALFGTTVVPEKRRKFGEFYVLSKEFT